MIGSNKPKDYHNKQLRFQEELKKESHKASLFRVPRKPCFTPLSLNTICMDIKTLLHNLREEVSCSVCSDLFTDPKHLPCLHSFCLHCLKQWHRTSHGCDTIRCPKCQAVSKIPESGDLKDLPTSFYLNGLIDVLAIKECRSSQVRCGNCEKKSFEASYCFQCCIFHCQDCVTAHNIMRSNKDHRVLALKDFHDKDYEDVLKRPVFCAKQRHEKKELEYFCKNCEMAVCQTCVLMDHPGHALEHIEDEAERQKIEMKSMMETQRRNLQAKLTAVSKLDEDYAKIMQRGEEVKRDIQRTADNLIANIEAKKQTIFAAVDDQTKKSLESLTTQKTEIENQIEVIKSSFDKADKVLTRSTNAEVVQVKKSLKAILKGVHPKTTKSTERDPNGLPTLVFVPNPDMLNTVNTEELGTLKILLPTEASQSVAEGKGIEEATVAVEAQFVLTTRNAEGRQCYNKHDRVTVEIRDEQGRECTTELQINDNKDGSYKISYSPKDQGKYKVTVKVNGNYVLDSPFPIEVKLFQLSPGFSFGKEGSFVGFFKYPWGVAVNAKDEIAVTDWSSHRVQIFNSDGKYLRTFGREGNKAGEFQYPTGITFHKNGNIFVADTSNHRVLIFSGEGEHVGMFGGKGSLDSQLSYPWGLSVDSDGNIIVADTGNKLIKIFSPDGKFLMKIGGQGSFTSKHCVQCDRYLIVSDHSEHCIKVFNYDGHFQYKFGKQGGGDGEFNCPCCLSVNKSGHLMVCDSGNHRMQVFQLNGNFVGKFGTGGRNLGEFDSPASLAVLSNGRIVVCEQNNHRIQILK